MSEDTLAGGSPTGEGPDDFAVGVAESIESFVLAIREIARGEDPNTAISLLLLEVSQLMLTGGRLGAVEDFVPRERFEPDPGDDPDVDGLRVSLANLLEQIDDYVEVFDPYDEDGDLVEARLSDDLAVVVVDLAHGLEHYRAGRVDEALWWWQFSYLSSWGSTAGAVLRALQSVVAHARLDSRLDPEAQAEEVLLAEVSARAVSGGEPPAR